MASEKRAYVGIVESRDPRDTRQNLVYLRPLAELSRDLKTVTWPLDEVSAQAEFPNQGIVDWYSPPARALPDTLWCFYRSEQPSYDSTKPYHNRYDVCSSPDPIPLVEVLDFADSDLEAARRFIRDGFLSPYTPCCRVYLIVTDDIWLGPVELISATGDQTWLFDTDTPLPYSAPFDSNLLLRIDQRLCLPPNTILPVKGQIDWSSDKEILRRVLRDLRRRDPDYTDQFGLTRAAIDHLVDLLFEEDSEDVSLGLERQRTDRARIIIQGLEEPSQRVELLSPLIPEILDLPQVHAEIEKNKAKAIQSAFEEINEDIKKNKKKLEEIQEAKHSAESELSKTIADLEVKRAEIDRLVQSFEEELDARLTEIAQRPAKIWADVAILRAGLGHGTGSKDSPSLRSTPAYSPWMAASYREVSTFDDFRRALRDSFSNYHLPALIAQCIHAAVIAGGIPLLYGSWSYEALEAYAAVATA